MLPLLLALKMVLGQEVATTPVVTATTAIGKVYVCPRCRRAKPPGPRKRRSPNKH